MAQTAASRYHDIKRREPIVAYSLAAG